MTAVEQVLEQIRETATDEHDKGDRFERLMLHAFLPGRPDVPTAVRAGLALDGLARTEQRRYQMLGRASYREPSIPCDASTPCASSARHTGLPVVRA